MARPFLVYLDQNVLSRLRQGERAKAEMESLTRKLNEFTTEQFGSSAIFVYSQTHVDECRASGAPEKFVEVIENLPAQFADFEYATSENLTLLSGRAYQKLLGAEEPVDKTKRLIESWLSQLQFMPGWLSADEAQSIKPQMQAEINSHFDQLQSLCQELSLPTEIEMDLTSRRSAIITELHDLDLTSRRNDAATALENLRDRLPNDKGQLNNIPNDKAVAHLFSYLGEEDLKQINHMYPPGFGRIPEKCQNGAITGLAMMLFMCGFISDKRVRRGTLENRRKYFLTQFRDCQHIENAAKSDAFITCDRGANRLASSIFSYADINTLAVHIELNNRAV